MKVGINSKPLPCPFWGAFGGGLAGSLLSGAFGLGNAALQRKYEKENMAIQNQYNIQAEERANAYNAPSAVRARMEQAGMNPQAFMGQSSGSGIQGGMSSAPTPSTSASMGSIDTSGISNLGSIMAQNRATEVNRQRMEADREKTYQEAKKISLENDRLEYERDQGAWASAVTDANAKAQISSANAIMAQIRSESYDALNRAEIAEKESHAEEMRKKIEHFDALIDQIKELTPEQKAMFKAQADKYREDARKQKADNDMFDAVGIRPGMDVKEALVAIGAKLGKFSREQIEKMLEDEGLATPGKKLPPTAAQAIRNAQDEFDKADKFSDKKAAERHRFRTMQNLATTFIY